MYYCEECGEFSFEPIYKTESYGQTFAHCRWCGSDQIEEAEKCVSCGEYKSSVELDEGLCKDCTNEIKTDFYRLMHDTATDHNISIDTTLDLFIDFIERYNE